MNKQTMLHKGIEPLDSWLRTKRYEPITSAGAKWGLSPLSRFAHTSVVEVVNSTRIRHRH